MVVTHRALEEKNGLLDRIRRKDAVHNVAQRVATRQGNAQNPAFILF